MARLMASPPNPALLSQSKQIKRQEQKHTVTLIVAISIEKRNLDTTIKQLPKSGKIVALQEVACSTELLSDNERETSEVEWNTQIFLNSSIVQVASCPTWWEVVNEW